MKLPRLEKPQAYAGLYVFDFGDHAGVGFTAQEVAELLESERYRHGKVYKIHKAYPDGGLELKGVHPETFQVESGMFFYGRTEDQSRDDFRRMVNLAVTVPPPCRAKVHLARYADGTCATGLIYPAEYEDEMSLWLDRGAYRAAGLAEGGVSAVQRYYDQAPEVLTRHQLYGESSVPSRTGEELLAHLGAAVQR